MADRYWVGGAGTWNTTSTTNWSASSGGASGASVPTASDSVFFNQAGTYTVTCTGALTCLDITVSAGTVTFATGTSPTFAISGSMSLAAGTVWSANGTITFNATTTGKTVTTNGTTLTGGVTFQGAGGGWTLGSALTLGNAANLSVVQGTFNTSTNNFAVSCGVLSSSSGLTRAIILNGSTVTYGVGVSGGIIVISNNAGLTFNAGTSTLTSNSSNVNFAGAGLTYNIVRFTNTSVTSHSVSGANTFNTLSFAGRASAGITTVSFFDDQTIGTLTLNAGTTAACRTFLTSSVIGTTRTLAVTTLSAGAADYDFRDIAVTGTAAPLTGTRFGDCKGNSGITFPAAKTVFYRQTGNNSWGVASAGSWSSTSGGALDATQFPLAQDTAVFPAATYPTSGSTVTINASYNIGTIDMSLRTANTMTVSISTASPQIYGNWINGTALNNPTGTGQFTFAGRGSQTITSATKTFAPGFIINTPGGSVTLQDDFACSSAVFTHTAGTFNVNGKSFALTSASAVFNSNNSNPRTIAIGSGTISINGSGTVWNCANSTNLTVTGTGIISLYSGSAKTFAGGGIQTYPTLQQGGIGTLTVSGNNKFNDLTTNDVGAVLFTSGTTNEFSAFSFTGSAGNVVTLGATTTAQATLRKPSTWYMGANSTNAGNNTGLTFAAGGGINYLSVSYINGVALGQTSTTNRNFFAFF